MKIRFTRTAATDRQAFIEGKEYEVPEADALTHIRAGHAVKAKEQLTEIDRLVAAGAKGR